MAAKAKVLTDLMKLDPKSQLVWTKECQNAFEELKREFGIEEGIH